MEIFPTFLCGRNELKNGVSGGFGEVTRETRPLTTTSILAPSHLGFFTKGLTYVFASKLEIFSTFEFGKNESKRCVS